LDSLNSKRAFAVAPGVSYEDMDIEHDYFLSFIESKKPNSIEEGWDSPCDMILVIKKHDNQLPAP
jgi:hypothetical protein